MREIDVLIDTTIERYKEYIEKKGEDSVGFIYSQVQRRATIPTNVEVVTEKIRKKIKSILKTKKKTVAEKTLDLIPEETELGDQN